MPAGRQGHCSLLPDSAQEKGTAHVERLNDNGDCSYTVPDWYPVLQEAVLSGQLTPEAFRDAKAIAARAAVKDQEVAGVEFVSDGELFRRDDNRFGPPNAMISYFAARIPGFSGELRPKTGITPVAPEASLPAPIVVERLEVTSLGLTDELNFLRATTE